MHLHAWHVRARMIICVACMTMACMRSRACALKVSVVALGAPAPHLSGCVHAPSLRGDLIGSIAIMRIAFSTHGHYILDACVSSHHTLHLITWLRSWLRGCGVPTTTSFHGAFSSDYLQSFVQFGFSGTQMWSVLIWLSFYARSIVLCSVLVASRSVTWLRLWLRGCGAILFLMLSARAACNSYTESISQCCSCRVSHLSCFSVLAWSLLLQCLSQCFPVALILSQCFSSVCSQSYDCNGA